MRRAIVALAIATGCNDHLGATTPDVDPAPLPGARCMAEITGAGVDVRVAVVAGAGVSSEDATEVLESARRYFVDHDVSVSIERIDRIDDRYLLGGTAGDLERALEAAGVEPGSPRARPIVAREIAGPLIAVLGGRARSEAVIDVIVVERIASPRSPVQMLVSDLAGLSLSPLLDPDPERSTGLTRALDIAGHVPTVLLSTRELGRMAPELRRTVAAHEIGHALGLAHRRERQNLMSPERESACLPGLDPDQLGQIVRGLASLTSCTQRSICD